MDVGFEERTRGGDNDGDGDDGDRGVMAQSMEESETRRKDARSESKARWRSAGSGRLLRKLLSRDASVDASASQRRSARFEQFSRKASSAASSEARCDGEDAAEQAAQASTRKSFGSLVQVRAAVKPALLLLRSGPAGSRTAAAAPTNIARGMMRTASSMYSLTDDDLRAKTPYLREHLVAPSHERDKNDASGNGGDADPLEDFEDDAFSVESCPEHADGGAQYDLCFDEVNSQLLEILALHEQDCANKRAFNAHSVSEPSRAHLRSKSSALDERRSAKPSSVLGDFFLGGFDFNGNSLEVRRNTRRNSTTRSARARITEWERAMAEERSSKSARSGLRDSPVSSNGSAGQSDVSEERVRSVAFRSRVEVRCYLATSPVEAVKTDFDEDAALREYAEIRGRCAKQQRGATLFARRKALVFA
uniref:Uncharacterized protein n=1 Tax=Erythrolobus australicus TaxID=1077150 RepID=A0A7S1TJT2_9RHOD|mmetsp:Transcript_1841/g.4873  ORF Transcript_1841/g.4873 Transcript_1841/m.4873 type:complete len:421 (+) Transcript_1841:237-1499(+)|eukprot:CAMPEP_0185835510 /NCGR_PEP_ID=MMETSP1353-20130828/7932_1 /TAXON_ID=1077150 /ORGANISM="Erythrolobus australicus, Strain CCMP3124" /LENGTH=420 /DNA_ID=CAMNT_0028534159 /DNA_START=231 /DNA_END=1493 /DNA_ORIENTATION=-